MRAADLSHTQLLDLQPSKGLIRFAGERALLLDAAALGLVRKYLVENIGTAAARAVVSHFGYALGRRLAETIQAAFPAETEEARLSIGLRMHALAGLFYVEPELTDPLAKEGIVVLGSVEAEQQITHLGQAEAPSCWMIGGLLSGYLSGQVERIAVEDRCVSMGHATCQFIVKRREEWAPSELPELSGFESIPFEKVVDESLQVAARALQATERELKERRRALTSLSPDLEEPTGITARSAPMGELVELVRRIAKVDATVLITGESGTGKERIARLIHDESTRAGGPFVAVNCAAITETLLESELFGHARGAFTGASHDRAGLFEAANGGTLLLDEVGEISAGMQVKLLRVLQEREVRRVGENKSRPINVRVLSATNRDLVHGVAGGAFRQDLYYRLKVVEAHVPSLRDRTADILPLASALLGAAARRMKRDVSGFSPTAIELLLHYGWPGNVRELENAMERAAALAKGSMVEERDLPEELRAIITVPPLDPNVRALAGIRPLAEIEKDYIVAALARNGGNQTHTAQQLKIGSATLYRKLRSYGMTSPRVPAGERKN